MGEGGRDIGRETRLDAMKDSFHAGCQYNACRGGAVSRITSLRGITRAPARVPAIFSSALCQCRTGYAQSLVMRNVKRETV